MSREQMAKIFEPFTQADTSTTRKYGGTGLGLSISKGLAERLGGSLELKSVLDQGTEITLNLPVCLPSKSQTLTAANAKKNAFESQVQEFAKVNLERVHVLVVDDQPTNRDLLELLLSDAGAKVTTANDGEHAIQLGMDATCNPDVILLDMQMPRVDGYTAARRLRTRGFEKPIIAMTANAMRGDDQKCQQAGCSSYLPKPLDLTQLLRMIQSCCPATSTAEESETHEEAATKQTTSKLTTTANKNTKAMTGSQQSDSDLLPNNWLREFACELIDRVTDELPQLINAYEIGDLSEVARLAHWMKGSGGTVGLPHLTNLAIQCEKALQKEQETEILETIQEINTFVQKVNQERNTQEVPRDALRSNASAAMINRSSESID